MYHLIKINKVGELNKISLFNGSIIKTCMGKKHVAAVASIKQMLELRSHKMTRDGIYICSDATDTQD